MKECYQEGYQVVIKGFKSHLAAEVFASWYEGCGEQAIGDVWRDMDDREYGIAPYCKELIRTEDGYVIEVRN
jgi:hypothetical protein